MKLYLEKRGCDFMEEDARQESDLENYRLFLEFIDPDGKRICGDVMRGAILSSDRKHGKPITISQNGLYTDFQYESHSGCYCYHPKIGCAGEFTKANVLKLVNSLSAVTYDSVEIVDRLPGAAHEYPECVLELERAYLASEHAAMVEEAEQTIRDNYTRWHSGLQWRFHHMAPDEYRRCTLIAFQAATEKYGVVEAKQEKTTEAGWVAFRLCKHFFEEQDFVDPYEDDAFLLELEKCCPYHVRRYLPQMSPQEFADRIEG